HNFSLNAVGRHPLVDSALEWGQGIWLMNLFARSRTNRALLFSLYSGLENAPPQVFKRVIAQQMLSGFFLPPTNSADLKDAPQPNLPATSVDIIGNLRPGGGNHASFQEHFGGVLPEFNRNKIWIDDTYGEVWSQSALNVSATESGYGVIGFVHQTRVDSNV